MGLEEEQMSMVILNGLFCIIVGLKMFILKLKIQFYRCWLDYRQRVLEFLRTFCRKEI
jgi:hypothetical protein